MSRLRPLPGHSHTMCFVLATNPTTLRASAERYLDPKVVFQCVTSRRRDAFINPAPGIMVVFESVRQLVTTAIPSSNSFKSLPSRSVTDP